MLTINKRNANFLAHMGSLGALGQVVYDMLKDGCDFFVATADLGFASGFTRIMKEFPQNYLNVGIAEQNLISAASGISKPNFPVLATSWGAFASYRCADQVRTFLGMMNCNVKLIGMGSGLSVSRFGGSHYGIGDIALMRAIPGLTIIAPCDGVEIYSSVFEIMKTERTAYIRLTGGDRLPIINKEQNYKFEIGKANILAEGEDVLLISCGTLLHECMEAEKILRGQGITTTILNMHTIKPLDTEAVRSRLNHKLIVTVEEHNVIGGLGAAVAEAIAEEALKPRHLLLGIEDFVPSAGEYGYLLEKCGLSSAQITERILKLLKR